MRGKCAAPRRLGVAERVKEAHNEVVRLRLPDPGIVTAGTLADRRCSRNTALRRRHRSRGVQQMMSLHGSSPPPWPVARRFRQIWLSSATTTARSQTCSTPACPACADAAAGGRALAAGVLAAFNGTALTFYDAAPTTAMAIRHRTPWRLRISSR